MGGGRAVCVCVCVWGGGGGGERVLAKRAGFDNFAYIYIILTEVRAIKHSPNQKREKEKLKGQRDPEKLTMHSVYLSVALPVAGKGVCPDILHGREKGVCPEYMILNGKGGFAPILFARRHGTRRVQCCPIKISVSYAFTARRLCKCDWTVALETQRFRH